MKYFFIALAICLPILFLSGCVQQSITSTKCAGVPQAMLVNCIYINAVEDQNPYYCYEIPIEKALARSTCLADASDYAKKKVLDRTVPSERDLIFVDTNITQPEQAPSQPSAGANTTEPTTPIVITSNMTDNETYNAAIGNNQITLCENIANSSVHNSCISQVAQQTKNVTSCSDLASQADQDLCHAYAQG